MDGKKKCMRDGCDHAATVVPLLRIPAKGWPIKFHTPCQMIIGIESCRDHFADMNAQELLTDEIREACGHMIRAIGKTAPDFERAEITPLKIDSDDYRDFVERRKPDA